MGSFPETHNYSTQSYYLHLVFSLQILSTVIPLDVITTLNVIYQPKIEIILRLEFGI